VGYDFSAVDGPASFRLGGIWVTVLLDALHHAGLLDAEARPPEPPDAVHARYALDDDELGDWPLDGTVTDDERTYFGWRAPDPSRVPVSKLCDNSTWIVSPPECIVLAHGIEAMLAGERPWRLSPHVDDELAARAFVGERRAQEVRSTLRGFREFCDRCSQQGGFWAY
jgi:hypothetical protein